MTDDLALNSVVAERIGSGQWAVGCVMGGGPQGRALKAIRAWLLGFDITPSERTVVIICERATPPDPKE